MSPLVQALKVWPLNYTQYFGDYRIHLKIKIGTGKLIINWNNWKSMKDTMDTMFVNKKDYQNIVTDVSSISWIRDSSIDVTP